MGSAGDEPGSIDRDQGLAPWVSVFVARIVQRNIKGPRKCMPAVEGRVAVEISRHSRSLIC